MATDITVLTAAEAKNASLALPAGGRCKVVWRITDDTVIHTWAGTVMEKLANWVVVVYSEGPTDPTVRYDLPYQSGGVQYIAIGPENDPRSAGNMLTAIRACSASRSGALKPGDTSSIRPRTTALPRVRS